MVKTILTAPASLPVSLAKAKEHLRVETDDDDSYITDLLSVAADYLMRNTGLCLINQSWRHYFEVSGANEYCLNLELGPITSVTAVTGFDFHGLSQTLALERASVNRFDAKHTVTVSVPSGIEQLELDGVFGFGETELDVPDTLRRAVLVLVDHWYEFRGHISAGEQPVSIPRGYETLVAPFRQRKL